jgi:hypothetical protein
MRGTLQQIKPLHPDLIPPTGAKPNGMVTLTGQVVYTLVRKMARSVPKLDTKAEGYSEAEAHRQHLLKTQGAEAAKEYFDTVIVPQFQEYRKNQMTGEKMHPIRRAELYDDKRMFYLESQGNGNVSVIDWAPPSAEQVADAERRQKIAEMKDALAERLVERGFSVDDVIDRLLGLPPAKEEVGSGSVVVQPQAADTDYPVQVGESTWKLSSGAQFQGAKEEAVAAEEAVREVRLEAAGLPEV